MIITSLSNPIIKHLTKLSRKSRYRRKTQRFLVEGKKEIQFALEGGYECHDMYCKEGEDEFEWIPKEISPTELSKKVYEHISYRSGTESFLAEFLIKPNDLVNWDSAGSKVYVILDEVEKPGNIGAILRTCDALGISGLILCGGGDPYSPNTIRSSVGCVFHVPIVTVEYSEIRNWLIDRKMHVYISHLDEHSLNFQKVKYKKPAVLILGSEAFGIRHDWDFPDAMKIKIPMYGKNDSLNVSVAAALLLVEILRK